MRIHSPGQTARHAAALLACSSNAFADETAIQLPDLHAVSFPLPGGSVSGLAVLHVGIGVCALGLLFGWWKYVQTRRLPVHPAMADVSQIIWETCKTYLQQQGRFLIGLWGLIAICMTYYFGGLAGRISAMLASSCFSRFSASSAATASPGSASASTPWPIPAPRSAP